MKQFINSIHSNSKEVLIRGWVTNVRILSKIAFLVVKDATGNVQCVATPELARGLKPDDAIELEGIVKIEAQAKQGFEIQVSKITVLNSSSSSLPFSSANKDLANSVHSDLLMDYRPLALRNNELGDIFRVQGDIVHEFRNFLRNNNFQEIITSKIVSSGTEGGTNLFQLKYFEKVAYLAQSPQFYKEYGTASFERVFETGHVYRAEPHATSRHLTEYYSLDLEMGFIASVHEVITMEKSLLTHIFTKLNEKYQKIFTTRGVEVLPSMMDVPTWSFQECLEKLKTHYQRTDLSDDLDGEAEKQLCALAEKEHGVPAVFVLGFPLANRPFYCHPLGSEGAASSFDLLFRGLEITSGGQRLHKRAEVEKALETKGLNKKDFEAHLKMYDIGMPPHGGFAIGLERLTALILGLKNVKEASMYPRDRNRLTP